MCVCIYLKMNKSADDFKFSIYHYFTCVLDFYVLFRRFDNQIAL